jgi:hypothetical protein
MLEITQIAQQLDTAEIASSRTVWLIGDRPLSSLLVEAVWTLKGSTRRYFDYFAYCVCADYLGMIRGQRVHYSIR